MKDKYTNHKFKELKAKKNEKSKLDKLHISNKKAKLKRLKSANKNPRGKKNINNETNNIIDVKGIDKYYVTGNTYSHVLKNISFSIKKGEFAVILGPSGSGKTTLLNVVSGLDRVTEGQVIVNNINLSSLKTSEMTTFRRNNVGFVFQSYNLLQELNAEDNALMGQQLQMDGNLRLDIYDLFEKVGLKGKEKSAVGELSGGQLQRISIIRALSKNPKIIFADEPTGALDSKTSEKVLELFEQINKKYKTTIIFVTHDEKVTRLANKIIKVNDGQVQVEEK